MSGLDLLVRSQKNQAILSDITKDLVELDDIDEAMEHLGEKIAKHFDVPWCILSELTDDTRTGVSSHGWSAAHVPPMKGTFRIADLWTPEQAIKINAGELFVTNDTQHDPRVYAGLLSTLNIRSFIGVPLSRNGKFKFLHAIMDNKPRQWRDDEISLMQELVSRIWIRLEKTRAEHALRKSEEKYRTLFESIDEGFCIVEIIWEDDGTIKEMIYREANMSYERHIGIKNIAGRKMSEVLPQLEQYWTDIYEQVIRTGEPALTENYSADLDGWYRMHNSRIGGENSPFIAVIFENITQRKKIEIALIESEERKAYLLKLSDALRPLANSMDIQETAARTLGEHLHANRTIYYEAEPEDDHYIHIVHKEYYTVPGMPGQIGRFSQDAFGKEIFKDLVHGQTLAVNDVNTCPQLTPEEILAYKAVGLQSFLAIPLVKDGRYVGGVCVQSLDVRTWKATEITLSEETAERTWAAVEKAKVEEQLHILLKQKDEFISIASHELKTPVTSIKIYAELLLEQFRANNDDASTALMEKMDRQIDALTNLVKDLLDTAKLSEGVLQLFPETFDINTLIIERIEEVERISAIHNIIFLPGSVHPVTADRERISQVITNLLTNAIKYSPEGGNVTVCSQETDERIKVTVEDKGIGIPANVLNKVFDRFFRVCNVQTRYFTGMGLGLYICSEIIRRHNGTMEVNSEEGKGTTFSFTLPLHV